MIQKRKNPAVQGGVRCASDWRHSPDYKPFGADIKHQPVDGAQLLEDIAETLRRFVVLPDHAAETVAFWILFAWAFDAWTIAPMIQISAPERECGKTRLLEVIGVMVPKPLPTGSISPAALFRVIEAHSPCLLVDEIDTFLADKPELVGILNNGYSRGQAFVVRCDGDDNAVKTFRVWGPKVLCGIGGLSAYLIACWNRLPEAERASFRRAAT